MTLTPKQKQLLAAFFDGGDELADSAMSLDDNEERTALALERKGLVSLNGTFEAMITDAGIAYAKKRLGI